MDFHIQSVELCGASVNGAIDAKDLSGRVLDNIDIHCDWPFGQKESNHSELSGFPGAVVRMIAQGLSPVM